jgi:pimeloyl-ACP methyl ester carboxylesterase
MPALQKPAAALATARRRRFLTIGAAMTLWLPSACMNMRNATVPMAGLTDQHQGESGARNLAVFLPGVFDTPQDFVSNHFVHELRRRQMPFDVVAADAHLDYFQTGTVVQRLEQDIIEPAMQRNPQQIWLIGISLGGLGAMLYASHDPRITGVVALAPYLGTKQALAEVKDAGGWAQWNPESSTAMLEWELGLHRWIKSYLTAPQKMPSLFLGYGEQDRFAAEQRQLAEQLPADHVLSIPGGHDWPTWQSLWRQLVERHGSQMMPR